MNNKKFVVFSQRVAGYLMLKGFVLLGMQFDKKDNKRNVFIFNDSDVLKNTIKEYKNIQL